MKITIKHNDVPIYEWDFDENNMLVIEDILKEYIIENDMENDRSYILEVGDGSYFLTKEEFSKISEQFSALCTSQSDAQQNYFNFFSGFAAPLTLLYSLPEKIRNTITSSRGEDSTIRSIVSNAVKGLGENLQWTQYYLDSILSGVQFLKSSYESLIPLYNLPYKNVTTAMRLAQKYMDFQESGTAKLYALTMSDEEVEALYYHQNGVEPKSSSEQSQRFQFLLELLDERQKAEINKQFENAQELYNRCLNPLLKDKVDWRGWSREEVEDWVISLYCQQHNTSLDNVNLEARVVIEMVTSKLLLHRLNHHSQEINSEHPQNIVYLISAHNELNRIRERKDCFTGEDFLRLKIRQLEFIYEGMEKYDWQMVFVDDEAPQKDKPRTIDIIEEMKELDSSVSKHRERIITLDYDRDLYEERKLYQGELSQFSAREFAEKSVKGGAIQTGLRYIARCAGVDKEYKTAQAHAIIYTDCDTSVNLSCSGILLDQLKTNDVAIGSRRLGNSHVIGKSSLRHLQSKIYNLLVRSLFNLQVTDTQVGAKAFKPEVITEISEHFSEVSMSFDVELLKLAKDRGYSISEDGIVWIDSELESMSANQGMNMFHGLIAIYQNYYKSYNYAEKDRDERGNVKLEAVATRLCQEPLFGNLIALASSQEWYFLSKNAVELYEIISPREWQAFVAHLYKVIDDIAHGKVDPKALAVFYQSSMELVSRLSKSKNFEFLIHLFPQLFDALELIHRDKEYARLIVPMLFGRNVVSKTLFHSEHDFYYEFHRNNTSIMQTFNTWLTHGVTHNKQMIAKQSIVRDEKRIKVGTLELEKLNDSLTSPITVSLTLFFNMNETSFDYFTRIISEKVHALKEEFGHLDKINWTLAIVDGRSEKTYFNNDEIEQLFTRLNAEGITIQHEIIERPGCRSKAQAVRLGMDLTSRDADFVGYVDFSDKIDIREIAHFLTSAVESQREKTDDRVVVIGSRRQLESNIVNKPLTFVLRSQGLNILVKALFPQLYHLSDTQTGFKLFSSSAWHEIAQQDLRCESLAFDVELLLHAANQNINIIERPVDFEDTNQNNNAVLGEHTIVTMLDDIVEMRGRIGNPSKEITMVPETRVLGGGAENVVFRLKNGSIVKIPQQILDPHYSGILKNVVFKHAKEMGLNDQQDKLISTGLINGLLTHPHLKKLIPSLRRWKDFNIFVMKTITAYENKNYKSRGYETAQKYGKDLVIPFRFVNEDFYLDINGDIRQFHPQDEIKQSVLADEVFNEKFRAEIEKFQQNIIDKEQLLNNLTRLINDGIDLFYCLWQRGLFDLDTNLMCDTGYYRDSNGHLRLMVLDPGELIDDLSEINKEYLSSGAREQFPKRYDFIEMAILLDKVPDVKEEVLGYYQRSMNQFYDHIQDDLERQENERDFARDRYPNDKDFSVQFDTEHYSLPQMDSLDRDLPDTERKKLLDLEYSRIGYQMPYCCCEDIHFVDRYKELQPDAFIHILPMGTVNKFIHIEGEHRICTQVGSILPTIQALNNSPEFSTRKNTSIILDAGSATRSSLLKFAVTEQTKGGIVVHGTPVYQKIACEISKLTQLDEFSHDFVVLTSSDDLMIFKDEDIQNIWNYFHSGKGRPGMYWCDLPHPNTYLPMTLEDTKQFLLNNEHILSEARLLLKSIPIAQGFIESGDYDVLTLAARYFMKAVATNAQQKESQNEHGINLPELSMLTDYYQQYIQYHAAQQLGGIKTPFLMIMTQDFYNDLKENLLPEIKPYLVNDISWESVIIRAMKCDHPVWQANRPKGWPKKSWSQVWRTMQDLKLKHHIKTDDPEQNEARVFKGQWYNFDDPQSVLRYLRASTQPIPLNVQINLYTDTEYVKNEYDISCGSKPCAVFMAQCSATPHIRIIDSPQKATPREGDVVLFYSIDFNKNIKEVYRNHLLTSIDGQIYSIPMHPMSKLSLKECMVYQYDSNGIPVEHMTFKEFSAKQGGKITQVMNKFNLWQDESSQLLHEGNKKEIHTDDNKDTSMKKDISKKLIL